MARTGRRAGLGARSRLAPGHGLLTSAPSQWLRGSLFGPHPLHPHLLTSSLCTVAPCSHQGPSPCGLGSLKLNPSIVSVASTLSDPLSSRLQTCPPQGSPPPTPPSTPGTCPNTTLLLFCSFSLLSLALSCPPVQVFCVRWHPPTHTLLSLLPREPEADPTTSLPPRLTPNAPGHTAQWQNKDSDPGSRHHPGLLPHPTSSLQSVYDTGGLGTPRRNETCDRDEEDFEVLVERVQAG